MAEMRVRKVWEEPQIFLLLPYLGIKCIFAKRETIRVQNVSGKKFMDTTLKVKELGNTCEVSCVEILCLSEDQMFPIT